MNNLDRKWVLTCFGTTIGVGSLLLPIQVGLSGLWATLFIILVVFPINYIAHRGVSRIVASSPKTTDIIGAIDHDLGHTVGFIVAILYFLSIVGACVGYATGLTNIISTFLTHHLHFGAVSRPIVTFIILVVITSIVLGSEKLIVTVTSATVLSLIAILIAFSIYLIPQWNIAALYRPFMLKDFLKHTLLLLPIFVFAMNFSSICSTVGAFYKKECNGNIDEAVKRSDSIIKWNCVLLLIFDMFFVISVSLVMTPETLQSAQIKNIDALTAISLVTQNHVVQYVQIFIAFFAITSAFFGNFIGTREGFSNIIMGIITWNNPSLKSKLNLGKIKIISTFILGALLWFLAIYNPSSLSIIGALSAPIIALYLFIMPIIMMKYVPRLRIYRSKVTVLTFIIGVLTIVGYYIGKIM
jgi:serine transporter